MQLFSTFETNTFLEMAISTLEKKGIPKENIFAVPLDNRKEDRKIFDSMHRSDGTTLIDIGMGSHLLGVNQCLYWVCYWLFYSAFF